MKATYHTKCTAIFRWVSLLIILLTSAGCKTHERIVEVEVPVETVRTEYRDRLIQRTDSVWLRDSIYIDRSRDTLLIERWHTKNVLKLQRDTVRVEHTDSIAVPVYLTRTEVQTVQVEKPRSFVDRSTSTIGIIALIAGALYVLWRLLKRWLQSKIPKI